MATTTKGFPYPASGDGRPHIDQAIAALAAYTDGTLDGLKDADIAALAFLWDGRLVLQTDQGAVRKWRGLYEYITSLPGFRSMVPVSATQIYTPALTASSVNPNLGAGGTANGRYTELGGWLQGRILLSFSGAGAAAGTGQWQVSLPAAAANANRVIGTARWERVSTPANTKFFKGVLELITSTTARIVGDAGELSSTTVPFTGNAGGLHCAFMYRRA